MPKQNCTLIAAIGHWASIPGRGPIGWDKGPGSPSGAAVPRRLTAFLALWGVLALAACGAPQAPPQTPDDSASILPARPTIAAATVVAPVTRTITPFPTPVKIVEQYVVRSGDTLVGIAARFDVDMQELMWLNGLTNPNVLQAGQTLRLPTQVSREAPSAFLLPDSEVVYSPAYLSFDAIGFANQKGGYLTTYREKVDGEWMTGPQIVQIIAERYSVGPRVLLALLEFYGGWVTNRSVSQTQLAYSMGYADPGKATLFYQASWAANRLNQGYYGKITGRLPAFQFKDRTRARVAPNANPGTVAIQNVLAQNAAWEPFLNQVGPGGFMATFHRLFGDPIPIDPLVPPDLEAPQMRLPWNNGATWYYTGGPHSPWGDLTAWGAIDVTPRDVAGAGCVPSKDWAVAVAPGRVIRVEHGRVMVSLSNSNFQGSGWALLYMHIATAGRAALGAQVNRGDPVGHPSCEGGYSNASHLHLARLYNGQWIDLSTVPFVLSGWQISSADREYDGKMTRGSETREALDTRNDFKNAIVADDGVQ